MSFGAPDGWAISFRRIGDTIETTGINFAGKITILDACGSHQLWRVAPGMVWSGMGRPWRRTLSRLLIVKVTSGTGAIVDECEPGRFYKVKRREMADRLAALSLG